MYYAKVIDNSNTYKQVVGVFENFGDHKMIDTFIRNYHSYAVSTFAPFKKNDQWYALYSPNYTGLSVMKITDKIEHLGGEPEVAHGFCPTEVFIPRYYNLELDIDGEILKSPEYEFEEEELKDVEIFFENFAFVAGCVWGDDLSWKIEMRDISKADQGIISRIDIGYLELHNKMRLKDAISIDSLTDSGDNYQTSLLRLAVTKTMHVTFEKDQFKIKKF